MLVVMSVGATEEEVQEVRRHIEADGLTPHESRGEQRVVIGVVGDVGLRKEQVMNHLAVLPGVESVTPISKPFKLTSRDFHPRGHRHQGGQHDHRRRLTDGHGRALRGREPRPAAAHRRRGGRGRRDGPARRRLQAAHQPLQLPGPGHGRPAVPGRGPRRDGPARHHRGHGAEPGGSRWPRSRRHPPDRRAQHAELPAAEGGGQGRAAGHAQARHLAPPSRSG